MLRYEHITDGGKYNTKRMKIQFMAKKLISTIDRQTKLKFSYSVALLSN